MPTMSNAFAIKKLLQLVVLAFIPGCTSGLIKDIVAAPVMLPISILEGAVQDTTGHNMGIVDKFYGRERSSSNLHDSSSSLNLSTDNLGSGGNGTTLNSPNHNSGAEVGQAVENSMKAIESAHAKAFNADVINWVGTNYSTIHVGWSNGLRVTANLIGSPARAGRVYFEGVDNVGIATVFTTSVTYQPGQNMVSTDLNVVPHKPGRIRIKAWIENYRQPDAIAYTYLTITR